MKTNIDDIELTSIMKNIMKDIQKDFHDPEFWKKSDREVEGLVMGIWEFKENAQELGFQIGLTQVFNRDSKKQFFIEEALIDFYLEVVQNSGVFLTHRFFDTRCQRKEQVVV